MDAGESKGERETKDHLEKDCREGERQSRVEELECGEGSGAKQRVLGKKRDQERDGLMRLLAPRDMMMMILRLAAREPCVFFEGNLFFFQINSNQHRNCN